MRVRFRRYPMTLAGFGLMMFCLALLTGASLTPVQEPAPPAATTQDVHPEFPPGPGRETTLAKCSRCHSPNNILAMGRDRDGWQNLLMKMVELGATGTDEEFSDILDYLSKSFPPSAPTRVNVNTGTVAQLAMVLALTNDEAKAIIDYRMKVGKYKTFDDLKKVPNVDAKKLDAKKASVLY